MYTFYPATALLPVWWYVLLFALIAVTLLFVYLLVRSRSKLICTLGKLTFGKYSLLLMAACVAGFMYVGLIGLLYRQWYWEPENLRVIATCDFAQLEDITHIECVVPEGVVLVRRVVQLQPINPVVLYYNDTP